MHGWRAGRVGRGQDCDPYMLQGLKPKGSMSQYGTQFGFKKIQHKSFFSLDIHYFAKRPDFAGLVGSRDSKEQGSRTWNPHWMLRAAVMSSARKAYRFGCQNASLLIKESGLKIKHIMDCGPSCHNNKVSGPSGLDTGHEVRLGLLFGEFRLVVR